MGLVLKIKVSTNNDCKSLVVYDITGNYNVTTNPTGYGFPNPAPNGETNTLSFAITGYTAAAVDIVLSGAQADAMRDVTGLTLTATDIYNTETFADGIHEITLEADWTLVGGDIYTVTNCECFICEIQCAVRKILLQLSSDACCISADKQQKMWKAVKLLKALESACCCGYITEFTVILNDLKKYTEGCSC